MVTDSTGWFVNQVEVDGQYFNGPGPATSANVRFYTDSGGLPGTQIADALERHLHRRPRPGRFRRSADAGASRSARACTGSPCRRTRTSRPTGQWGWTDRTVSANSGAAWRNPGGGFGAPACIAWGRRPTTCGIDAPAPDQVFRLLGNIGAGGPSLIHDQATVYDQDGDGYLEPGETFELDERVRNTGGATATNITSVLSSSTSGVSITQPNSAYPNIPAGGTGTNSTRFGGAVSNSIVCGTILNFSLAVTTAQGNYTVPFTVPMVPCPNYTITTEAGQSIVPGTFNIENSCDDCTTAITLPFPVYVYGQPYTSAVVESNGTIQFTGDTSVFTNTCLPGDSYGRTLFPYWDDLCTDGGGTTASTRPSPAARRTAVFYIEWRTTYFSGGGTANFEMVFNENNQVLKTSTARSRRAARLRRRECRTPLRACSPSTGAMDPAARSRPGSL